MINNLNSLFLIGLFFDLVVNYLCLIFCLFIQRGAGSLGHGKIALQAPSSSLHSIQLLLFSLFPFHFQFEPGRNIRLLANLSNQA